MTVKCLLNLSVQLQSFGSRMTVFLWWEILFTLWRIWRVFYTTSHSKGASLILNSDLWILRSSCNFLRYDSSSQEYSWSLYPFHLKKHIFSVLLRVGNKLFKFVFHISISKSHGWRKWSFRLDSSSKSA